MTDIIILKINNNNKKWSNFLKRLKNNNDCIYFTTKKYHDFIDNLFNENKDISYDIIIYKLNKDKFEKLDIDNAWYAKARYTGVNKNLNIENAVELNKKTYNKINNLIASKSEIIDNDKYIYNK